MEIQPLPEQCFCPPAPFHIREKQRAIEAVRRLRRPSHELGYWAEVNRAEAVLRSAIRAHRFAVMKNSAVQTFGTVHREHAIAKGYIQREEVTA